MSGFSTQWLDAREPVDHAARNGEILSAILNYFSDKNLLRITDIGCGTGSTLRALKPLMSSKLEWHLIDNDDALLASARQAAGGDKILFSSGDLSQSLNLVFDQQPSLITTSAFLDLVSHNWLEYLCREVTQRNIPFYAALSYDGRNICQPPHIHDEAVLTAFNQHQKRDKGFGPALGPAAADTAVSLFEDAGYLVTTGPSDWIGDSNHPVFQQMLLEGWHAAASEIEPENGKLFDNWLADRKKLISTGNSTIKVGHLDFFAVPRDLTG